jgi:tRNA1Val (adenine37-N6)-methyltransferase
MANDYFRFRQFTIQQGRSAFKVGTDGVLLGACADLADPRAILDIGTGTGLVAIMMAQRSNAMITAIEPDRASFKQALENIRSCRWADRIVVINTDLQGFCKDCSDKFDLVISNPPYFRRSLKNPDPVKSMTRHEDSLTSTDILSNTDIILNPAGSLQIILPYVEGGIFIDEAREYNLCCTMMIKVKPTPAREVRRLILKFERMNLPVYERLITIETGKRHDYTKEYKDITRDFYPG